MTKESKDLISNRKTEIIRACSKLYREKNFKDIKLQEIADATTMTRTAMYSYFKTKEEIFLALLQNEYEQWNDELMNVYNSYDKLSHIELAECLSKSLDNRIQLLKLMSMNNFELEAQSRYERVVEYKRALGQSMKIIRKFLDKYCLDMNEEEKERFVYMFFPFTFGLFPYTNLNDKAIQAMKDADVEFHYYSIYELSYNFIIKTLK